MQNSNIKSPFSSTLHYLAVEEWQSCQAGYALPCFVSRFLTGHKSRAVVAGRREPPQSASHSTALLSCPAVLLTQSSRTDRTIYHPLLNICVTAAARLYTLLDYYTCIHNLICFTYFFHLFILVEFITRWLIKLKGKSCITTP